MKNLIAWAVVKEDKLITTEYNLLAIYISRHSANLFRDGDEKVIKVEIRECK